MTKFEVYLVLLILFTGTCFAFEIKNKLKTNKKTRVAYVGGKEQFRCNTVTDYVSRYTHDWYRYKSTVKWFFNDSLNEIKTNVIKYRVKPISFLTVRNITHNDAGTYTCHVHYTDTKKYVKVQYTLQVKDYYEVGNNPPVIKKRKHFHFVVQVGKSWRLKCPLLPGTGTAPLNVIWLRHGRKMDTSLVSPKGYVFQNHKMELIIRKANVLDEGAYTCIVSNRYGSDTYTQVFESYGVLDKFPLFLYYKKKSIIHMHAFSKYPISLDVHPIKKNVRFIRCEKINATFTDKKEVSFPYKIKEHLNRFNRPTKLSLEFTMVTGKMTNAVHYIVVIEDIRARGSEKKLRTESYEIVIINRDELKDDRNKVAILESKDGRNKVAIISISVVVPAVICALAFSVYCFYRVHKRGVEEGYIPDVILNLHSFIRLDPMWEVPYENIEFRQLLGEGTFGRVVLAKVVGLPNIRGETLVAVKSIKANGTEEDINDLLKEMDIMKGVGRHDNIINLLGVTTQNNHLCLIVEYCKFGSLRDYLRLHRPNTELLVQQELDLLSISLQASRGLEYLAQHKIIHRDIAARNLLVAENHLIKVADFGLSRNMNESGYYRRKTIEGLLPVKWMAPESIFDQVFTTKSDVWSYGILLWEIVTLGGSPYPGVSGPELMVLLKKCYRMSRPSHCSPQMYQLMLMCWQQDPGLRPSFTEVVNYLEAASDNSSSTYLRFHVDP